jgi:hypothetical protein
MAVRLRSIETIVRLIRSHKPIAILFAASLIVSQLCGGCTNTDKNTHFVKTMGSCNQQTTIEIFDETGGDDPQPRSMTNSGHSHFKNYVNTISKYVFTKIDEMGQCQRNGQDNPQVKLVFVYRPIVSNGIMPFKFERTKYNGAKYLDSPWVKLTMSKSPKLFVHAAFVWNERQFFLDQAMLSGMRTDTIKSLSPLNRRILTSFVADYEKNVSWEFSKKEKDIAVANLSKRLPPDILCLFSHSGQPDGILNLLQARQDTVEQVSTKYIDITTTLLNRRFALVETKQDYQSVLDLKDIFNIDRYRIQSLRN